MVGQKDFDLGDKLWIYGVSLQLTDKETAVNVAKRFGKIKVDYIKIILITDVCCHPLLQHKKVKEIGLFGKKPIL